MRSRAILITAIAFVAADAHATVPQQISVQGVLRNNQGALLSTMVPMTARFFDLGTAGSGNQYGGDISLSLVPVINGLFTATVTLPPAVATALQKPTSVFLELQISGEIYSRQPVTSQLYALMCGEADNASAIGGVSVATTAPTSGQVLRYNGTQWAPAVEANGAVTSVTASAPLSVINSTTTPIISLPSGSLTHSHAVGLQYGGTGTAVVANGTTGSCCSYCPAGSIAITAACTSSPPATGMAIVNMFLDIANDRFCCDLSNQSGSTRTWNCTAVCISSTTNSPMLPP